MWRVEAQSMQKMRGNGNGDLLAGAESKGSAHRSLGKHCVASTLQGRNHRQKNRRFQHNFLELFSSRTQENLVLVFSSRLGFAVV
jgi:hypothetical protein